MMVKVHLEIQINNLNMTLEEEFIHLLLIHVDSYLYAYLFIAF